MNWKRLRRIICWRKGHDYRWAYNDWTLPGTCIINDLCARCTEPRKRVVEFATGPIKVSLHTDGKTVRAESDLRIYGSGADGGHIEETHRIYSSSGARFRWPGLWR